MLGKLRSDTPYVELAESTTAGGSGKRDSKSTPTLSNAISAGKLTADDMAPLTMYGCSDYMASACCCFFTTFRSSVASLLNEPIADIPKEKLKTLYRLISKESSAYEKTLANAVKKALGKEILSHLHSKADADELENFIYEGCSNDEAKDRVLTSWLGYDSGKISEDGIRNIENNALKEVKQRSNRLVHERSLSSGLFSRSVSNPVVTSPELKS